MQPCRELHIGIFFRNYIHLYKQINMLFCTGECVSFQKKNIETQSFFQGFTHSTIWSICVF